MKEIYSRITVTISKSEVRFINAFGQLKHFHKNSPSHVFKLDIIMIYMEKSLFGFLKLFFCNEFIYPV